MSARQIQCIHFDKQSDTDRTARKWMPMLIFIWYDSMSDLWASVCACICVWWIRWYVFVWHSLYYATHPFMCLHRILVLLLLFLHNITPHSQFHKFIYVVPLSSSYFFQMLAYIRYWMSHATAATLLFSSYFLYLSIYFDFLYFGVIDVTTSLYMFWLRYVCASVCE